MLPERRVIDDLRLNIDGIGSRSIQASVLKDELGIEITAVS
jgi:hypothetical protein